MTRFNDHNKTPLYDGDRQFGSVTVEIEAESNHSDWNEEVLDAVERIDEVVKRELQAIQDELDEGDS